MDAYHFSSRQQTTIFDRYCAQLHISHWPILKCSKLSWGGNGRSIGILLPLCYQSALLISKQGDGQVSNYSGENPSAIWAESLQEWIALGRKCIWSFIQNGWGRWIQTQWCESAGHELWLIHNRIYIANGTVNLNDGSNCRITVHQELPNQNIDSAPHSIQIWGQKCTNIHTVSVEPRRMERHLRCLQSSGRKLQIR